MKQIFLMATDDTAKIIADNAFVTLVASVLLAMFGLLYGNSTLTGYGMTLVIILITLDWLTGFSAAKKYQIDTSSYGIEGLIRTAVLLLLPAAAHFVDKFFLTQGLASYFMIAALARHLTKSFIANAIRVGWTQWIPVTFIDGLSKWVADELAHKHTRTKKRFEEIYGKEENK